VIRGGFPQSVDIPIPSSGGPSHIEEMFAWCEKIFKIGAWSIAGHSDLGKSYPPRQSIRFYFRNEADAEAFRQRWAIT
jgi:hypothetical protein